MHALTIILVFLHATCVSLLHKKCCDADSYLRRNNSVYFCDRSEDKRLQIFTNETNFLKNGGEGTCFETHPQVTEYKIGNHSIEEKAILVNFYPKCCPLGYFYHSIAHSCVWTDNKNESFVTQNFIKVGLEGCRVIVDYALIPGWFRMELGNLFIDETVKFQEGEFCVDKNEDDVLMARGCFDDLGVCYKGMRCIHKCCPDGQSFVNGQKCVDTFKHGLNLSFTDRINDSQAPFAIVHKYDCRIYILQKKIQFYLDLDGTFFAFSNKTNSFLPFGVDDKSYCIEHISKGKMNSFQFLMCFPDGTIEGKFLAARWAKIVSCVFIFFTMAVYFFLPEMLNLFGKILMSYCFAVLTIFIFLIYAQFETNISDYACIIASFLSSYMSLASFSWMNVMCFDIYWTFGTPKSFVTSKQRKSELKRFLLYSLYGWGIPAVLTLLTYSAYSVDTPDAVKPLLGAYKCFWERRSGNYGMFLFYVTPLILMEISNLVLFLRTVFYCLKVKGEINRLNDNRILAKERRKYYNIDKEQLLLILKLSVTMGISFTFEVVSSLFNFSVNTTMEYIEIVWDTINCLQGVFIFLIFICKAKVFRLCKNRFVASKDRKISVSSQRTSTTQVTELLTSKPKFRKN